MKFLKLLVVSALLMIGNCIAPAQTNRQKVSGKFTFANPIAPVQTNRQKVSGKFTFANPIPMPLGRYVQLADSTCDFTIQGYLASNDYYASDEPQLLATYLIKFKIVRHIPELEFMSFRAETLSEDKSYMKFKSDQNAVEMLSEAIADKGVSEITVPWSKVGNGDIKSLYRKLNRKQMKFNDSSLYRRVPQSNVKLVGFESNSIILTEPATLKFYSEDGLGWLYFTIAVKYSKIARNNDDQTAADPAHAVVSTASGSFSAVLKSEAIGETVFWFDEFFLTPRDMDKLLTELVTVTIYNK